MSSLGVLLALALSSGGHELNAGALPICSNRTISELVKRAGCTVGDARCWARSGGFCTDYVAARLRDDGGGKEPQLESVKPAEVRRGDVAVFLSRAHYAYVERVVTDGKGRPVAVDVSEYNHGTCWVDADLMVTDRYKVLNRRAGIALSDVDGGFLRRRSGAR